MTGREKILQAAFELISERGFASVSIRDIGDRAGLTNPALYQHFKNKHALGLELYRQCYTELLTEIDRRIDDTLSPLEKLEAYIDAAVKLHRKSPSPLLFLDDEQRLFGPDMFDLFPGETITERLTRWIDDGKASKTIRNDIPTRMLVALTIGQVTKWAAMSSMGFAPKRGAATSLKAMLHAALTKTSKKAVKVT